MSGMSEEPFTGAPMLGEHTEEILSELLKYSQDEVDKLRKEKVI
jgi:crotonobetainyl-CoA:carnitine CoA-transferase CaiB-like acyl-CoA transferase